jgi:hypothetical protein
MCKFCAESEHWTNSGGHLSFMLSTHFFTLFLSKLWIKNRICKISADLYCVALQVVQITIFACEHPAGNKNAERGYPVMQERSMNVRIGG